MSPQYQNNPKDNFRAMAFLGSIAIFVFVIIVLLSSGTYIVQPGYRGVEVTLGKVSSDFKPEGFGLKKPFISTIQQISVRQQSHAMPAECYSSDLQQVKTELYVLYRIPEQSVVRIFTDYAGDPFGALIVPRVLEALKEVAAAHSAERIVKERESVKQKTLDLAQRKVGTNFLQIVDVVLYNITLSPELEQAIEMKMVQEQEAEKAKFLQLKAQIDSEIAIIRAKGESDAIQARGTALRASPEFIKLQIIQNWNGHSPLVVGGDAANLMLPSDATRTAPPGTIRAPVRTPPVRRP